jgi:hypothetical protein
MDIKESALKVAVEKFPPWMPEQDPQQIFCRPLSTANPRTGCNSDRARYSNNFAKPIPLFEHEHEDDFDASCEGGPVFKPVPGVKTPG